MNIPLYKLQSTDSSYNDQLETALGSLRNQEQETDLCLISEDGENIFTHKSLVCLYSSSLAKYLNDVPCCNETNISIPVSSLAINNLLKILVQGFVTSDDSEQLSDVTEAAKILGIELELGIELGSENDGTNLDESCNMIIKTEPEISKLRRKKKPKKIETKKENNIISKQKKTNYKSQRRLNENKRKSFIKVKEEHDDKKYEVENLLEEDGLNQVSELKCDVIFKVSKEKHTKTCNICYKMFTSKQKLTNHIMTHTGEKPFACDQCEKQFSRKDKLKYHLNIVHNITYTKNDEPIKKPFPCDQCEKGFSRKDGLKHHQKSHTA